MTRHYLIPWIENKNQQQAWIVVNGEESRGTTTVETFTSRATSSTCFIKCTSTREAPLSMGFQENLGVRYYRESGHYPRRRRATSSFQHAAIGDLSYEPRPLRGVHASTWIRDAIMQRAGRRWDRGKRGNHRSGGSRRYSFVRFVRLSFGRRARARGVVHSGNFLSAF